MFKVPSLCGSLSSCWLNLEQSGGQERDRKPQLRKELRGKRDFLRNNARLKQIVWGQAHILRISEFLQTTLPGRATAAEFWTQPWAAYFPIGSELGLLGHCPMEQCWLPYALTDGSLKWFPWQSDIETWSKDALSLPQPPASVEMSPTLPAVPTPLMVLTPCLAVDCSGTRLGYGGGYYDRFFAEHGAHTLIVACVPHELRLAHNTLPREPHDVSVDLIVTEKLVEIVRAEKFELFVKNWL